MGLHFVERMENMPKANFHSASSSKDAVGNQDEVVASAHPVRLAVFDFDGTSISAASPVLLVSHLMKQGMLKKRVVSRIMLWAAAYKLRLPLNESAVRGLVFTAFEGKSVTEVNEFMSNFYDETIEPLFRADADAAMRAHCEAGDVVMVVSASFEPIILRAMQKHPFAHQVSTRMKVSSEGTYMRRVEGLPVEGEEKLAAVKRFGDDQYGVGNWEIIAAYGDHHSDKTILSAAKQPYAVCPNNLLAKIAKENDWPILEW